MMVDPDGQRVFFAKGVSDKFKKSFAATVKYMNKKGTSDGLFKLERSPKDYYIDEVQGKSSSFSIIGNKNTIFWNSSNIISSRDGIWRSPATSLDHEIAHAVHYDTDPQGFTSDIGTPGTDYVTKEERNVIVGREQSTARKHGEIRNDQVTRTDYYGKTVSGDVSEKSPEEIELIIQSQNELL